MHDGSSLPSTGFNEFLYELLLIINLSADKVALKVHSVKAPHLTILSFPSAVKDTKWGWITTHLLCLLSQFQNRAEFGLKPLSVFNNALVS